MSWNKGWYYCKILYYVNSEVKRKKNILKCSQIYWKGIYTWRKILPRRPYLRYKKTKLKHEKVYLTLSFTVLWNKNDFTITLCLKLFYIFKIFKLLILKKYVNQFIDYDWKMNRYKESCYITIDWMTHLWNINEFNL